ncbi:hypothetical protein [Saccharopolyspora sp. CA-218241]|uniref:hypothetical protein n=1 Tax=Saccharopolyspora sp. CA-218241 TaxID=3240027 RepID=UPI003D974598
MRFGAAPDGQRGLAALRDLPRPWGGGPNEVDRSEIDEQLLIGSWRASPLPPAAWMPRSTSCGPPATRCAMPRPPRLSSFVRHHINRLGRYSCLTPGLAGGLWPLRDLSEPDEGDGA